MGLLYVIHRLDNLNYDGFKSLNILKVKRSGDENALNGDEEALRGNGEPLNGNGNASKGDGETLKGDGNTLLLHFNDIDIALYASS